ncbi:MAG: 16S rRNA (cytosine(967)-C(5))-methyltransferase RsmB [Firmicutes bacterium]|nr:16S rRNA (cytosine(967)-C(5))-methyltransferase RsmB [Bacillota bacterium]
MIREGDCPGIRPETGATGTGVVRSADWIIRILFRGMIVDKNRLAAYEALLKIENDGAYSNLAAGRAINEYRPENEAFVRNLIYGVLENQILIDYQLDGFIKSGIRKVKPRARILLRMGAYQLEFMDNVPDYAAVSETVQIARKKCPGLSRFINGVLRSYQRTSEKRRLPDREKDSVSYCSVKYSYNREIADLWIRRFGLDRAESLMAAGNETPPLTIRVNTLKTTVDRLSERLASGGFSVTAPDTEGMSAEEARLLQEQVLCVSGGGLIESGEFREGLFYIQDISSVRAVAALSPKEGTQLIDVCSAPGGKSFSASMLMRNKGRILSCDIYEHKLDLIRETADRLGLENMEVMRKDAAAFDPDLEEQADFIIADVPCSGLGVIRRRPEIKFRMTEKDIENLSALQYSILENASRYVRIKGRLMYSTCTISEEENEKNIRKFLDQNKNFRILAERQLFPDRDHSDGFYYCVMERE